MDPTTKEGRERMRHAHAQMLAEERTAKALGRTPSSAPTVRWMTATTDNMLAALSHIEKLEKERDALQHGLGKSLEVALREREEVLAERDTLRAELERARKALRKAAGYVTGPETESLSAVKTEITAALSPSPAPVETPPAPYEPSEAIPLGAVLRALYASEINASIEWLWDGGYQVCVGGSPYGGWEAHNSFKEEDFDKIAPWLIKEAGQQFPSSTFTLETAPALIAAHNARSKTWK